MGFFSCQNFGSRLLDWFLSLLRLIGISLVRQPKTETQKKSDSTKEPNNLKDAQEMGREELGRLMIPSASKETIMILRGSKLAAFAHDIEKAAKDADPSLGVALVAAVCMVESSGNPYAVRYEPHWKHFLDVHEWARKIVASSHTEGMMQASSWGLMQVMGTVARELGHKGWISELIEPPVGLKYGCMKLKECLDKHGYEGGIAAYNAGTPRKKADGKFFNQPYVDKVLQHQKEFLEITLT